MTDAPVVLVADDDSDIRALVARSLRHGGYELRLARDGEEALRLAREQPPDLALLDVAMPGLDGYEVTRRLRSHPPTSAVPILLVTARARREDESRGLAAGASGYVRKPFGARELRERVEELLAGVTAPLVLVADDDADIRRLVGQVLRRAGLRVIEATDGDEALELSRRRRPDLLLLDVSMPGRDGYAVCGELLEQEPFPPPVIFLTALGHVAARVRGLDAGAVDYVTKPFDGHELVARVRAALRSKAERDRLEREALTDRLTGLLNRRALDWRLEQAVAVAGRYGRPLACALLDVDDFKPINDAFGHAAGDAVLAEVAARLRGAARASDVVARHGGDEFALVIEGADREAALRAAERLRQAVCACDVELPGGRGLTVTLSAGVALLEPGMAPAALAAAADAALYEAKRAGKNAVAVRSLAA